MTFGREDRGERCGTESDSPATVRPPKNRVAAEAIPLTKVRRVSFIRAALYLDRRFSSMYFQLLPMDFSVVSFQLHAQQRAQYILARLYGFNDWADLVE